jgi:anthranilate/para-aminobenzoate synthase component I
MADPWTDFANRSERSEVAGYFERSGGSGRGPGLAVSFTRADEVVTLRPTSDMQDIARTTERFLRQGRHRSVLGYAGFDAVGLFEPALRSFPSGSPFPLGEFALARDVRVTSAPPPRAKPSRPRSVRPPSGDSMPRPRFEASVRRLRRDIRDGEAYQVVLAHRRSWPRPTDLFERAGRLRSTERYAFFFYLKFGDRELVCATPESVVEVEGSNALVNPIAGTIPTGSAGFGRLPLEVDPKELAEHRMLVDLARNDLGSVARPGTVHLLFQERRERYARLEHLVSRVAAQLRPGVGPWEALAATFPAGTVSGAPKIRATELLRREEGTWRGPYAGAVGLLRPGGRADWALTIRAGFAAGRKLFTAAGGGIVYRSEPRREFEETLTKLAHVEATLVGGPA